MTDAQRAAVGRVAGYSQLEELLLLHILAERLPEPEREYEFARVALGRAWRFDLAWPLRRRPLAVEIEGGVRMIGRHQRPGGFADDLVKYRAAVQLGWDVLRFSGAEVRDGTAVREIHAALLR